MKNEEALSHLSPHLMKKRLRAARKSLAKKPFLWGNRLLEKKLPYLIATAGGKRLITKDGKNPLLGEKIANLDEISTDSVTELISALQGSLYLSESEFSALLWQAEYALICGAVERATENNAASFLEKIYALQELDEQAINKLNPLHKAFAADEIYAASSERTQSIYRSKAAAIALSVGIEEQRYAFELMTVTAKEQPPAGVGSLIWRDFRRVHHHANTKTYLAVVFGVSAAAAILTALFSAWWCGILAFLPCVGIVKPLCDSVISRTVKGGGMLPRLRFDLPEQAPEKPVAAASPAINAEQLPDFLKPTNTAILFEQAPPPPPKKIPLEIPSVLCVISTLAGDEAALEEALARLRTARVKNPEQGIYFALLCDFPAASEEKIPADRVLLKCAEAVRDRVFGKDCVIFFRKREFSKTERKWQGSDRKRGAVEQLVKHLCGEKTSFRAIIGDDSALRKCRYLCALDMDTVPLMGSIKELAAIAAHPLNRKFGIIAQRVTPSLASTLRTPFARLMAGNGGVSGISAYDSVCGELYFDCFGEGIFCGKGLLDVRQFREKCCGIFPSERVLSHDILEGELAKTAFAGDVEFSDNFPSGSKAFMKRAHRWLRGDFQNLRFLFRSGLEPLSRFKLFDNARRGINPLLILAMLFIAPFEGDSLAVAALLSLLMPFIPAFFGAVKRGLVFGLTRQFYSPIASAAAQIALRALAELLLLPYNAIVSLSAAAKAFWRSVVSKRHLLEWVTSGALEKTALGKGFGGLLLPFGLSVLLLICSVLGGSGLVLITAVLMAAALPVFAYADKPDGRENTDLTSKMRTELLRQCEMMWSFYDKFVDKTSSFLPPDNVQFSPVYRVCSRTSPTNIGMYLLSCLAVAELGIIDNEQLFERVEKTLGTVKKLEKWHGNLFNWYETETLKPAAQFVSSVDSGNFVCCLVALLEGIRSRGAENRLLLAVEEIIGSTDLTPFYNKRRDLFSIGFDVEKNELSPHHYDLLMSEARMLSFYAIACGFAPKRHWRALGRTMSRCGRYAGAVAWTGTMFEFFMPELLLKSQEGSMSYEALKYALYCQKRRHTPWGMSESGYYAFDRSLNYQYKAHGVQKAGLRAGLGEECVISPYSSFLTLSLDPGDSYNNLARLEEEGALNPLFGFYEAVDYTKWRVGDKAVVKSHMAHHVGMSIAGAANALCGGVLCNYFMKNEKMQRAAELLEERVMAGERVLKITEPAPERVRLPAEREEMPEASVFAPRVNALYGGGLTLLTTDTGVFSGIYNNVSTVRETTDFYRRPSGAFYGFVEDKAAYPFVSHPSVQTRMKTTFTASESVYELDENSLHFEMTVTAGGDDAVEFRHFSAKNNGREKKQLTLCAFSEPVLAPREDFAAHPMFMELFLKIRFDRKNKLFILTRKDRHSESRIVCACGFVGEEDFTFLFSREDVQTVQPFGFFAKASARHSSEKSVPSPCLFIKADMPLDAGENRTATLFYCYGASVGEVTKLAEKIRGNKLQKSGNLSPLARSTVHGRMAARLLPSLVFGAEPSLKIREARRENILPARALWRFGISGDKRLLVFDGHSGLSPLKSVLLLKEGLAICGLAGDLVILCDNALQKGIAERTAEAASDGVFLLIREELEPQLLTLVYALAVDVLSEQESESPVNKPLLPLHHVSGQAGEAGFSGENYTVKADGEAFPWCNVLAGRQFGCLVSQNSLGFSWALNSRENKLVPWSNDLVRDNDGELLLLRGQDGYYDLVRGSKAVFAPNYATYYGTLGEISSEISVTVSESGMGKEITLTLINGGDKELCGDIAYYIEPLLAADRRHSQPRASVRDRTVTVKNPLNAYFRGEMQLSCAKAKRVSFSKPSFWAGEYTEISDAREQSAGMAAVIIPLRLPPREREKIRFILSYTLDEEQGGKMTEAVKSSAPAAIANKLEINTPDRELNALFNHWLPWQALGGRMWARTGFFQNGGAYGFRDQLQDALSVMYFLPEEAERQILRACASQFEQGDVLHWWHELVSVKNGVRTRYSDDLLWLPYVAGCYAEFSGKSDFWDVETAYCVGKELPADRHELFMEVSQSDKQASVYIHCKKAMEKGFNKGQHGLIKIGCGDWNDGYNNVGFKGEGVSVWLSMFYIMCARKFAAVAKARHDGAYAEKLEKRAADLVAAIDGSAWDKTHYLRAFYDDGEPMGGSDSDSCQIDLLPQSFATLCGMPDVTRQITAVDSAFRQLVDEKNGIIKLFSPPFSHESEKDPGYVKSYPEGVRENGGQYTHAAVWFCMACFELGQNDRAFRLLEMLNPAKKSAKFGREPYFMTADIYTNPDCYGRGGWSIYTGAAGWYYKCILEGLFGVRICGGKAKITPRLPKEWSGSRLEMTLFDTEISLTFTSGGEAQAVEIPLDGHRHEQEIVF